MSESESVEYISTEIVEEILRDWVNAAHRLTTIDIDPERSQHEAGQAYGASLMRNVYLAEPHLLTAKIRDALKLAGRQPPLGAVDVTYGETK